MSQQAEHKSMRDYLESRLSASQLSTVIFPSFTQWPFALAALADTALSLRSMGSDVQVGFWANRTPLHDMAWTTDDRFARLLLGSTPDELTRRGLLAEGLDSRAFVAPPIRHWRPTTRIDIGQTLNRSHIRELTYRGTPMGRAILQVHPDRNTPITDDHLWPRKWVNAAARSYAFVYDQVTELIRQSEATAVVVFNGRFLHDRAAAEAARTQGLPVLSFDIGGSDTGFDLTVESTHDWPEYQRRMLRLYDRWDPDSRETLGASWFEERANHSDPLNSHFIDAQEKGTGLGRVEGQRLVVYFSSSGDEVAELEYDWSEYFGGQANALKLLAEACRRRPDYSLVVRSHPHKRRKPTRDVEDWLEAVSDAKPDVHLDPHSTVDSYQLMREADVVVTYGSTTGVEAAFAGKPVIVMGPSVYDLLGCAVDVHTVEELQDALDRASAGEWDGVLAYGLMMRRRGFVHEHVNSSGRDEFEVGGVRIDQVAPRVRHASHLAGRFEAWRLNRRRDAR
ncbi:MAG: hypothetical protein K9G24_01745 [Candidatus Nanopelagicales bacterium]|nr:hypothetical protein [Candidatus Nanopelagicales bacterium]MCF8536799.1 hypothetical protein [Candidatus Nanopelagicales bacterium]MCF8541784.1 hypothetical protein [Candidatus Nanopelagicales bacterium]MCF8556175.1 hypothetical protein [Candidatus Nanopelagicales bacterium]